MLIFCRVLYMLKIAFLQEGEYMKLVLFGGIQGVGKTTLISWLKQTFPRQLKILDAGEMFRRYVYGQRKIKSAKEVEKLIVEKLLAWPRNAVVVVHWHYAIRRPEGYIPQIHFSRLARIARSGKIAHATLLLVETSAKRILKRRWDNRETKTRPLLLATIRRETRKEEKFLAKTYQMFSQELGRKRVTKYRLRDTRLPVAKKRLARYFEALLARMAR